MTELLPCVELNPTVPPKATVIWLHGLGADGNDFVPIVNQLNLPTRTQLRFVFPHAPHRPITINGGYIMRGWYDIAGFDAAQEDTVGIRDSARQIEALILRELEQGIPADRIVLAGFSQGGALALHTSLRYPLRLAGILALSAYLPLANTLAVERHAANQDIPIFMAHGDADSVIALPHAWASKRHLESLGYAVEWHRYAMPHSVCADEIADIAAWLPRVGSLPA